MDKETADLLLAAQVLRLAKEMRTAARTEAQASAAKIQSPKAPDAAYLPGNEHLFAEEDAGRAAVRQIKKAATASWDAENPLEVFLSKAVAQLKEVSAFIRDS